MTENRRSVNMAPPPAEDVSQRVSAKSVLEFKIKQLERRIASLLAVHANINWDKLEGEEEHLLYEFFMSTNVR